MKKMLRIIGPVAVLSALLMVNGCSVSPGSSTVGTQVPTQGPSGKVTQGPVAGATVWASHLPVDQVATGPDELATVTTSLADGTFVLPVQPTYSYVIVSVGGTDTITGRQGTTMLAPAGCNSVSPLTTLVTFDPALAATINAMLPPGKNFTDDLSGSNSLTPAALLLINSVESTVNALNSALTNSSTTNGSTLTTAQQSADQMSTYSNIAKQLSGLTATQLQTPSSLASSLTTAVSNTLSASGATISGNTSISTIAAVVADNAVASAAQVVGVATGNAQLQSVTAANVSSSTTAVATNSDLTEATAMNTGNNLATISNAVSTGTAQSANVTVTSTSYVTTQTPIVIPPVITGYSLSANDNTHGLWTISTFTINFSEAMNAASSGNAGFANSVLNPANVFDNYGSCTPLTFNVTNNQLSMTCSAPIPPGPMTLTIKGNITDATLASSLLVDNTKTFNFTAPPSSTGATGGSGSGTGITF